MTKIKLGQKAELKHFKVTVNNDDYRVAVRFTEYAKLQVKRLGRPIPSVALKDVILEYLDEDGLRIAEELHQGRKNKYSIDIHTGASGCSDGYLVELLNAEWKNYYKRWLLHTSARGKVNRGLDIWLGDVPVLFEILDKSKSGLRVYIEEAEIKEYDFKYPSSKKDCVVVDGRVLINAKTLSRLREISAELDK